MPTARFRSLKAFKPQIFSSLEVYKGAFPCIITALRPVGCHRLAVAKVEQQNKVARGERLGLVYYLSPPPLSSYCCNNLKVRLPPLSNGCLRWGNNGVLFTENLFVLKMKTEKGNFSNEKNQKKEGEVAEEEDESVRLKKQQEREEKEEEERKRVRKEQEMEEKIGPPPEKPLPGDCCGQGCEVCIWDTYWDELAEYKKLRKAAEESG